MDISPRLPAEHHQRRAAHFRALAADATTSRAKEYLLGMARYCDGLASGNGELAAVPMFGDEADDDNGSPR